MATISPQEAKRVAVVALRCTQVLISTFSRQENVGRAVTYDVKRCIEFCDPRDSLSSIEAEACKRPHYSRGNFQGFY